jgi:hypothetical protein
MPSTAAQAIGIVAEAFTPCKEGRLLPFTRHPKILARVHRLRLQACCARVLEVLLTYADADGVCWPQPDEIVQLMPRSARIEAYSLASVLRALRTLRSLGLLSWTVVQPFGRFPGRVRGRLVWRGGRATSSGGRVWAIHLEKLRGAPLAGTALSTVGTELGGEITSDRSRSITHDRPSDPWFSLRENKIDPARHRGGAPATPPASRVASETPSAATTRRREPAATSPAPAHDASASTARPTVAHVASETPGAVPAVPAARHPAGEANRETGIEGEEQIVSHRRRQRVGTLPTPRAMQEAMFSRVAEILGVPVERIRR